MSNLPGTGPQPPGTPPSGPPPQPVPATRRAEEDSELDRKHAEWLAQQGVSPREEKA